MACSKPDRRLSRARTPWRLDSPTQVSAQHSFGRSASKRLWWQSIHKTAKSANTCPLNMPSKSNSTYAARVRLVLSRSARNVRPLDTIPQRCASERLRRSWTIECGEAPAAPATPRLFRSRSTSAPSR